MAEQTEGTRVTATDVATGESQSAVIVNDAEAKTYRCGQWATNCNNRAWPPIHTVACAERNAHPASTPDLRERVARALYDADYSDIDPDERDDAWPRIKCGPEGTRWHVQADAVLAVLAEGEAE